MIIRSAVLDLLSGYLADVSRSAHRQLGEVAGVAVTMATDADGPVTAGASTQLALDVDAFQFSVGRGPCLTALSGGGGRYVPDLGASTLWGDYGPGATELGVRSCLSLPVQVEDDVLAVVKVYSAEVDGLDERQRRLGERVAVEMVGGLALAQTLDVTSTELEDRSEAMGHRRTIDLALGMVMERVGCDADRAFDLLRMSSQRRNAKVRDVAAELVAEHTSVDQRVTGVGHRVDGAPFRPRDDARTFAGAAERPTGSKPDVR